MISRDQVRARIRQILLEEWDPIGVGGEPGAQDEYDGHIDAVLGLLQAGASTRRVAEYLAQVERDSMQLSGSADRLMGVAELLQAVDVAIGPSGAA